MLSQSTLQAPHASASPTNMNGQMRDILQHRNSPQSKAKSRSFKSGMTREFAVLLGLNVAAGLLILYLGTCMNAVWMGRGHLFVGIGILAISCAALLSRRAFGKEVTITERAITWREGNEEIQIPWDRLKVFQAVNKVERKYVRTQIFGDDSRNFSLESLAFKDFDLIVSIAGVARKRAREKAYEIR